MHRLWWAVRFNIGVWSSGREFALSLLFLRCFLLVGGSCSVALSDLCDRHDDAAEEESEEEGSRFSWPWSYWEAQKASRRKGKRWRYASPQDLVRQVPSRLLWESRDEILSQEHQQVLLPDRECGQALVPSSRGREEEGKRGEECAFTRCNAAWLLQSARERRPPWTTHGGEGQVLLQARREENQGGRRCCRSYCVIRVWGVLKLYGWFRVCWTRGAEIARLVLEHLKQL